MSEQVYQELITEGIRGLPEELLSQIADFVYFVRRRVAQPKAYETEMYSTLLQTELGRMNQHQLSHLEEEFANYEQQFPKE